MIQIIASLLTTAAVLSVAVGYAGNMQPPATTGQTYVLVHGAWQAPYVWEAVQAGLLQHGNNVVVVELPGHGTDKTPPHLLSLDAYTARVVDAVSQVKGSVILVGHSMGGMVITQVAEKIPQKIRKLVYIGAFLPASGQALTDLAAADPASRLGPLLTPSADQLTLDVKQDSLTQLFIADGSDAAKQKVMDNYRPEPAIPFTGKALLTPENFGRVEKVYIKTLQDAVISPAFQDRMIAAAGIHNVYGLHTSHSPFLSQPAAVTALLLSIAAPDNGQEAVAILTRYEAKKGQEQACREALAQYVRQAGTQADNIMAEGYYEQEAPAVYWVIERWSDSGKWDKARKQSVTERLPGGQLVHPARSFYIKDLEPLTKEEWDNTPAPTDSPITVMLFIDSKPGTEEHFRSIYHTAMPHFRGEPGVISYQLSQLEEDATRFVTYEKFRDEAAFRYHLNFPPTQPVLDYLNTSIKKQPFQAGLHKLVAFAPAKEK